MPRKNLQEQIQSIQYRERNTEDYDNIIETTPQNTVTNKTNGVVMLPIDKLVEYKDENFEKLTGKPQPFNAYTQEEIESLSRSIARQGVIDPITVRPWQNGYFQILAGRNRMRASILCGLTEIPGIIRRDIDDTQAALIMLDTNLEHRELKYSEKAYAYRMRIELQGSQGKRTDLEEGSERIDTLASAGQQHKDSRRTVAYLIRLTYLIPGLLSMVDDGKIGFKIGVGISYLSQETQEYLLHNILPTGVKVKSSQIADLRKMQEYQALTPDVIQRVLSQKKEPFLSFTIKGKQYQEYADLLSDQETTKKLFLEFLKTYKEQRSA